MFFNKCCNLQGFQHGWKVGRDIEGRNTLKEIPSHLEIAFRINNLKTQVLALEHKRCVHAVSLGRIPSSHIGNQVQASLDFQPKNNYLNQTRAQGQLDEDIYPSQLNNE